ncbi:helix-turn-helix domain-containing protein [Photobacterium swingsii]|uniref:helix-turn-helix domain-containing protein n=1 Tax=Photobacterium swingsii TaxID=680026 RepID=UPI0040688C81
MTVDNREIALVHRKDVAFFSELFKTLDHDMYALFRESRIPNDLHDIEKKYDYLPEKALKNLIQILGSQTSPDQFGLLVWSVCHDVYIPRLIQNLTQTTNLKSALDECCELLQQTSTGSQVKTELRRGKWWIVREKPFSDDLWFQYAEMFSVIFIHELLTVLTAGKWQATEVALQSYNAELFQAFSPLKNKQLYTARAVMAVAIPDALMLGPLSLPRHISPTRRHLPDATEDTFLSVFKVAIKPYLSMGKLSIKWAADILGLNVRTLQRRLEKEGAVYSDIIEEMVFEQIIELICHSDLSLTEIAGKMGYSDSAHFTRAFKRQMKMTPSQYRKVNKR